MSWSERAKQTGARLAENFGAEIILLHVTEGAYNPATRTRATTTTPYTVQATVTTRAEHDAAGRLVKSDKRTVLIPASGLPAGVKVTKSDRIQLGDDVFAILDLQVQSPAGTVISYMADIEA